jgi:phenylalanyl-tRNA synthetase beta chain
MLRRDVADKFNHTFLFGEDAGGRQAPAGSDPGQSVNGDARDRAPSSNGTVETLNPISQEMAALRPSLLPGALQVVSFNRKHGRSRLRFFEYGHVYRKSRRDDVIVSGYAEHESLILVASGPAAPVGWDVEERPVDLFDLKGVVAMLLDSVRLPDVSFEPDYHATAITTHHLTIQSGETRIGVLGRLADAVARDYDLMDALFFAEINWQSVVDAAGAHGDRRYVAVSRYPIVERDLAVIIDRAEPAGHLMRTIREQAGPLLRSVEPFDLYEGERIGKGKKSIAFSLRFGADRTLLDEEVDERVDAVVGALAKNHGGELRG